MTSCTARTASPVLPWRTWTTSWGHGRGADDAVRHEARGPSGRRARPASVRGPKLPSTVTGCCRARSRCCSGRTGKTSSPRRTSGHGAIGSGDMPASSRMRGAVAHLRTAGVSQARRRCQPRGDRRVAPMGQVRAVRRRTGRCHPRACRLRRRACRRRIAAVRACGLRARFGQRTAGVEPRRLPLLARCGAAALGREGRVRIGLVPVGGRPADQVVLVGHVAPSVGVRDRHGAAVGGWTP
jgi:hypothetical protein